MDAAAFRAEWRFPDRVVDLPWALERSAAREASPLCLSCFAIISFPAASPELPPWFAFAAAFAAAASCFARHPRSRTSAFTAALASSAWSVLRGKSWKSNLGAEDACGASRRDAFPLGSAAASEASRVMSATPPGPPPGPPDEGMRPSASGLASSSPPPALPLPPSPALPSPPRSSFASSSSSEPPASIASRFPPPLCAPHRTSSGEHSLRSGEKGGTGVRVRGVR